MAVAVLLRPSPRAPNIARWRVPCPYSGSNVPDFTPLFPAAGKRQQHEEVTVYASSFYVRPTRRPAGADVGVWRRRLWRGRDR